MITGKDERLPASNPPMKQYGWLRCALEAILCVLIYYPVRALADHLLMDPAGTPMHIWPLSEWFERGPDAFELITVGVMVWFVAGILRAQRKELFDE